MKFRKAQVFAAAAPLLLVACGAPEPVKQAAVEPPAAPASSAPAPPPAPPQPSSNPLAQAIDRAQYAPGVQPEPLGNLTIKAEVLLSRAHFSPGVIDGRDGQNLKNALLAYERANDLPQDGLMDTEVWKRLAAADTGPIMADYVIAEADVAGPFAAAIPKDYAAMAKLPALSYTSPLEALAEKFHMDEALLRSLNPDVDFGVAGTKILVVIPGPETLPAPVTLVEVDKARNQVRAYGADGALLAAYPATVGSSDMPTPSGTWAVANVALDPDWHYDPSKLNFGDRSAGKLDIKSGPNNPVGAVWIALTKPTYGIHGAPEPKLVGKTASHGCVRLTNWDARQLASAVTKGVKVVFVGEEDAGSSV